MGDQLVNLALGEENFHIGYRTIAFIQLEFRIWRQ